MENGETEYERNREEELKKVVWKPRVCEKGMMVLGKHHGAFPAYTWPDLENIQYCRSPLLLHPLPFIPHFSANGRVL